MELTEGKVKKKKDYKDIKVIVKISKNSVLYPNLQILFLPLLLSY